MVGMVIPGTMGEHDVGLPFADDVGDLLPRLEVRHQLAVVDVEHVGRTRASCAGLDLGLPALRQRAPRLSKCPTSPFVSDTSFTLCPCAAMSVAVPANFSSASSGCAPKATTRRDARGRRLRRIDLRKRAPARQTKRSDQNDDQTSNRNACSTSLGAYPILSRCLSRNCAGWRDGDPGRVGV